MKCASISLSQARELVTHFLCVYQSVIVQLARFYAYYKCKVMANPLNVHCTQNYTNYTHSLAQRHTQTYFIVKYRNRSKVVSFWGGV